MLYKAMQVKEIPIIFRGDINNGSLPEPDIKKSVSSFSYNGTWYYTSHFDCTNFLGKSKIYVTVNDKYYGELSEQVISGSHVYGATFKQNPSSHYEWDVYPFAISAYTNEFAVSAPSNDPLDIKIWFDEPKIIPVKKTLSAELTGNGQIKRFHARFACGENGTLRLNPYVILNGNITINLCDFAKGSDNYISGDNEDFTFECYVPVETHAVVCLDVENVGEYPSIVDAAIVVQYEDFIEEETIVGYEGINLRRNHR